MAPKKKTSASDFRRAEETSKKSFSSSTTRGIDYKGKPVKWDTPGTRKPTEAITNVGQKATGLVKSTVKDRFDNNPGKKSGVQSNKAVNALNFAGKQAAIGVASMGAGSIVSGAAAAGAKILGTKASGKVAQAAFEASSKGLGALGAGGKVRTVVTPMGKTLGSTKIGSTAQQTARMNNLTINAEKNALAAGKIIGGQVTRGITVAGKVVGFGTSAAGTLIGNKISPKKKK